jgi:hypothetical protein
MYHYFTTVSDQVKKTLLGIFFIFFLFISLFIVTSPAQAADSYALSFDGVDDYVDISTTPAIGNSSVTVEVWLKPASFGDWDYVFTYGKTGDNPLISFILNSTGKIVGYVEADGTNQVSSSSDGSSLTLNEWNHVAIVLDRTNNTLTRYLNGEQSGTQNSTSILGTATISSLDNVLIASADNKKAGEYFNGELDELRIWTTARTQAQIQAEMTTEIVSNENLIGRWGFGEGSDITTTDTAGSSIVGSIMGASWVSEYNYESSTSITVTTVAPTTLRSTTATLTGNIVSLGGESSVDVYFKYGMDPLNLGNTTASTRVSDLGTFSANVEDLIPKTTYYYQAFASGGGSVQNGLVESFGVKALEFDASDNVKAGDLTAIESSQYLTVEAYAKGYDFTNSIIVSKHSALTTGSFYLAYLNANTIRFTVITDVGRYDYDVTQTLDNEWHHIAGVYDSVAQTVKIYYDGLQIGTTGTYSGTIKANTIQLIIGNYNTNDWSWVGQIDEVRIWNIARTEEQIITNKNSEIESADGLIARWGLNEGAGLEVYDSTGNGNIGTITGANWIEGLSFNASPNMSYITYPANNSTSISLSPQFIVQPTDPENQNLTVKLYGRLKQISEPEDDFTIVLLPDTQNYSATYPNIFTSLTTWIINNLSELNIKMVLHEGDVVNTGSNTTQWSNAMTALNILSQNNIPNLISIGNHDYNTISSRSTTTFNSNINFTNWYSPKSWFNGAAFETDKSENVYTKMTIGSKNYLFMTLEFGPRDETLAWARSVIEAHPDHIVFIVTHNYMYSDNTRVGDGDSWNPHSYISTNVNDGEEMWENLASLYPNVLMVFSGHILNDGLGKLTSTGVEGNLVHQILANYQMNTSGGGGYLRYLTFKPSENKINIYTYSPYSSEFKTSSDNQFSYDYDFNSTSNYTLIDTKTNVPSGTNIDLNWTDLETNQEYEWYITVSDGKNNINTSVNTFRTNNKPNVTISEPSTEWQSGDVTITYTITDSDNTVFNILQTNESGIEYSTDGNVWHDATESLIGSDGLSNLAKDIELNFVWDTTADIPNIEDETVYIRIRPNDGDLSAATWQISNPFKIDNAGPTEVNQVTFSEIGTDTVTITKPSTITEIGSGISQWRITNNNDYQSSFMDISIESLTVSSLSENTAYTYAAQFKDTKGNVSSAGSTNTFYTKVADPTNINANSITQNQIVLTVDDFPNDTNLNSGYFFERAGKNSGWIQTNTWTDTNLSCETSYTYYIKYRNTDSVETAHASLSVSTSSCSSTSNSSTNSSSSSSNSNSSNNSATTQTTTPSPSTTPITVKKENNFFVIPDNIVFKKLESDVPFFESVAGGIALKINENTNTLSLFNGQELKISIKPKKKVKSIIVEILLKSITQNNNKIKPFSFIKTIYAQKLNIEKYTLTDEDKDGIYEGNLKISNVPGDYEIKTLITYNDETNKEVVSKAKVQSTGYIYELLSGKQARISNAEISLSIFNEITKEFEPWDADKFHQKNPIITNETGEYIFFVPDGKYFLEVKTNKYKPYKSEEIIINDNNYINENIKLIPLNNQFNYIKIISISAVILVMFSVVFIFIRKPKKKYPTKY